MKLKGRKAIVVGAGQVIGSAIALAFCEEGAEVALVGRSPKTLNESARSLGSRGYKALEIVADITDEAQVNRMVDTVVKAYGRIDILVNSAGHVGPTVPLPQLEKSDWDAVIAVNLTGPYLCCRSVLRQMIKQGSGNIISLSGTAGKEGMPLRAPLSAAKWGLQGLMQTIARESGAYGIRANTLLPGGVHTPRLKHVLAERAQALNSTAEEVEQGFLRASALGRFATPEEVARACVFLASDDSSMITGEALNFSGGAVMH
jgi:NAD(P)-dependent dehydrogenase (short-subunit alcohol dehydrogenase family)